MLIFFVAINVYAQNKFDYNFYFNATSGFGIPINNTSNEVFNASKISYDGIFLDKAASFIKIVLAFVTLV